MTKTLGTITAAILLTGSMMIVHADDKKKHQAPLLAKYQGVEKKIKAAVEAGKLSEGDAKKKLIGAKKEIWGAVKDKKKRSGKKAGKHDKSERGSKREAQDERKSKFMAMEKEIWTAVKKGKLSKKDAMKKLEALKEKMSGGHEKGDWSEKKKGSDGREAKFRAMEEKIRAAVKSGKMSRDDAGKKLAGLKEAIWPDRQGHEKKNPAGNKKDPRAAKFHEAEKEIIAAVKAGKISREDAGKKLSALKGQLWGGDTNKPRGKEAAEKQLDTPRAKYQAVAKRIAIAVKEGKISKTDGEKRLLAYRKQLGADSKAGSRAGAGAGAGKGAGAKAKNPERNPAKGNTKPRPQIPGRPR